MPAYSSKNYLVFECASRPQTKMDCGRWTGLNNMVPVAPVNMAVISINVIVLLIFKAELILCCVEYCERKFSRIKPTLEHTGGN